MKTPREKMRRLVVAIALIGLAVGSVAHAEEEQPTLIDQLKKEMLGIQNNITNGEDEAPEPDERALIGGRGRQRAGSASDSPAEACCSRNLENIRKHAESMNRTFEQLYLHYSDRNQAAALIEVDQVRGQLSVVSRGTAVFKMAGSNGQAEQALFGLIRPFNELRAGIARLEALLLRGLPAAAVESGSSNREMTAGSNPRAVPDLTSRLGA